MKEITFTPADVLPALRTSRLGRNLSSDELSTLFQFCSLYRYNPGEAIISEGEANHDMYVVVKNSVIVEITAESTGSKAYVDTLSEGEIIGEAALFVNAKRTAHVRAADEADLLRLSRQEFFRLLGANTKIGIKLLFMIIYSLLGRLRAANEELAFERRLDSGQDDIDDLVAQMLPQDAFDTIFKSDVSKTSKE